MTGDWKQGLTAGALAGVGMKAMKAAGKRVDEEIMRNVAEMLLSPDPAMINRAIQNATMSKAHMDALDAIMRGLAVGARGAALATVND